MIYLSAFDPRARYLTGMGQEFNPRARYLTGLRRRGLGQDVPNLTPNFPAFPGGLVTPMPEPPIPIVFPDTSGPIVTTHPRVAATLPPPNLTPTGYPATLPGGILAQPTPYALLPPSPSNLVQQAGGWLQQQAIAGIPNKYLLIGGGVLLFLMMGSGGGKRRRR